MKHIGQASVHIACLGKHPFYESVERFAVLFGVHAVPVRGGLGLIRFTIFVLVGKQGVLHNAEIGGFTVFRVGNDQSLSRAGIHLHIPKDAFHQSGRIICHFIPQTVG